MSKFKIVNNNTCSKINVLDLDLEKFQYKLIEDWERQQVVKGFTKETVALNLRNIDEFIKFNKKYVWEISAEDVENFITVWLERDYLIVLEGNISLTYQHFIHF